MDYYISNFIYGSIDGIITTIALISSSIGSNQTLQTTLVLTTASILTDGLSMSYGSYESHLDKYGIKVAFITFISFVVMGLIPLYTYYKYHDIQKLIFNLFILLFIIGYIKASYTNQQNKIKYTMKTVILGFMASFVGYNSAKYIQNKIDSNSI